MITPMTTEPTRARMPIVVYWRRMNATAPSKMVPATACISTVPVSRASTSRARYPANSTAMMPAGRMISWSVLASIRVVGSSTKSVTGVRPWRERVRRCGRVSGELAAAPTASTVGWDHAGRRECIAQRIGGSNSRRAVGYASPCPWQETVPACGCADRPATSGGAPGAARGRPTSCAPILPDL